VALVVPQIPTTLNLKLKMKLKRYDIKRIYADPVLRREMIAKSTVVTMAREGVDITLQESLDSYDKVMKEKHEKSKNIP